LAVVIEQTVKQLLFGPGRACDPPPTMATKHISTARQRRKVFSGTKSGRATNSDTKNDTRIDTKSGGIKSEGNNNNMHY